MDEWVTKVVRQVAKKARRSIGVTYQMLLERGLESLRENPGGFFGD